MSAGIVTNVLFYGLQKSAIFGVPKQILRDTGTELFTSNKTGTNRIPSIGPPVGDCDSLRGLRATPLPTRLQQTCAISVCLGVTVARKNKQMSHTVIIRFLTGVGSNGLELRDLVRHGRRQGALLYRRQGT